jgi:hypothetical protein
LTGRRRNSFNLLLSLKITAQKSKLADAIGENFMRRFRSARLAAPSARGANPAAPPVAYL